MTPLPRSVALVLTAALAAGALTGAAGAATAGTPAAADAAVLAGTPATATATAPALDHRDAYSETVVTALPATGGQTPREGRAHHHSELTPTGRFVRAGDVLTFTVTEADVAVGFAIAATGAYADLNRGATGTRTPTATTLAAGTSRVTAASDGLVYLRAVGSGSARVRVSGGAPQPVFQLGSTTRADLDAQMAQWPGSRFVLFLSQRFIAEFQRDEVVAVRKSSSWDPAATFAYWDRSADLVAEAHGLDPAAAGVARSAGNRIRTVNPDTGTAWATAGAGALMFQKSSGAGQRVLGAAPGSSQWGLWHEIGHTYQNAAYRWSGMTEVQVNLYASHVQRRLGHASRYTSSLEAVRKAKALFATPVEQRASSGMAHELMFEQLGRAFGDAFYPRLNQAYRVAAATGSTPTDDTRRQQQLIRTASAVSGYDLSEFFRQWGVPADAATLAEVGPLPDLPQPIWTTFEATSMPLVRDLPPYVLPVGTVDPAGLPTVSLGWTTAPEDWRDRVRDVGSLDGSTPATVRDAGTTTSAGSARMWVRLDNALGVTEVLTTALPFGRGTGLTLRGIHDQESVHLTVAPDTGRWDARTNGTWVHDSFGAQKYLSVELRSPDGTTLASGAANGNQTARSLTDALHGQPFEDGQYLLVHHREPQRLDAYSAGAALARTGDRDQAFRVEGGVLQRIPTDQAATPPVLSVEPGVDAAVVSVTMSASVFERASRHVVRHGSTYAFEIYRGTAPYGLVTRSAAGDTVTVSRVLPARTGDEVSLHRVSGRPGQSSTHATRIQALTVSTTEPTAEQVGGVLGVTASPGTLALRLTPEAFASTTRYVVVVNGTYQLETVSGSAYYASRSTRDGVTTVSRSVPALAAGDVVEVRIASSLPGTSTSGRTVHTHTVTADEVPVG
jgi:hypothetical protein